MPWNGRRQYSTSLSERANQMLASLTVSCCYYLTRQRRRVGKSRAHPVDRIPVQMIHCVLTLPTSTATRTLHRMPDTEHGKKRSVAPMGPVIWTCW